jgi:N utilization substance protein B
VRRRIVREKVVQALYAHEISGDPPEHVIHCILSGLEDNKPAYDFARRLVLHTISHAAEIDRIIRAKVANELAKLFSTERSGQFINGVLDAVLNEMKASGGLAKAGRGLYDGLGKPKRGPAKNS